MFANCHLTRVSKILSLAFLLPFLLLRPAFAEAGKAPNGEWVAAWATALQSVADNAEAPSYDRAPVLQNQTIRQIIYPRISGHTLRLRLSNIDGRTPVTLSDVHVALVKQGAATVPGSDRQVHFGRLGEVTLAAGQRRESDPIDINVPAGQPLAVSFFVRGAAIPTTWHKLASQVAYFSGPGNYAAETSSKPFKPSATAYFWLDQVAVRADQPGAVAVAAIGDSITDGMRSTLNANRRWPDELAKRLQAAGMGQISVLNLGISGNRLLSDSPCYGDSLDGRFERDALAQVGVRSAIVLIGINDINFAAMPPRRGLDCDEPHTKVDAAALIAGYRRLITEAHQRNVRIYGATLTPADLPPAREAIRQAVNQWIRTGGGFDGVIDFDAALRDPARPTVLERRFDSGDGIHPSDAGYARMAEAIPLTLVGNR